jgi:hypothetical protein
MTMGEPKIGPVTASPMAKPRLRRNHREMITGQVTAWLTPDAPREIITKKRKNATMPLVKPRPRKPADEMTALQKISLRALKRSSRKPTTGLRMPDSSWRSDMAAEITQRSQPKVRSIGIIRTPKPWK